MTNKINSLFKNRWFKFSISAIIYTLWFLVWAQIWWSAIGLLLIYDYYISEYYKKIFWNKHTAQKAKSRIYKEVMSWVEAILYAVVFASLIKMFFIQMYVIPSSSMEKTLLVGDYLGVSLFHYGTKLPNTPLSFPLVHNISPIDNTKKSYLDWIERPYNRLKGCNTVKNYEVFVFNYPEGDTVLVSNQQQNYYQLVRQYGREKLIKSNEIMTHPVDKRDNYIKRAIGIPGDVLEVKNGTVFINSVEEPNRDTRQFRYEVTTNGKRISKNTLSKLNVTPDDMQFSSDGKTIHASLSDESVKEVKKIEGVDEVKRLHFDYIDIDIFPHDTLNYKWSTDNFGPLTIPKKGVTVNINEITLPLYSRIISTYEDNTLELKDQDIFINGQKADKYTFKMDYYFAMGDNRHNSLDSRYWGFVPEDHIVGKASFVWFSLDPYKSFPMNIRFNRMFRKIK